MTELIHVTPPISMHVKWYLNIGEFSHIDVSDPVFFHNRKFNLEFHVCSRNTDTSYLYLCFKNCNEEQSTVAVMVRSYIKNTNVVGFSPMQTTCIKNDKEEKQIIWTYDKRLPNLTIVTFNIIMCECTFCPFGKVHKETQVSSYKDGCFAVDNLSQDFSKLLDEGPDHDVEFTCEDQTFKAHKSILCCRSTVFAKMLQSDMVEGKTGQVNIKDINATIFRQFLGCLYTGKLPELTVETAVQLYEAADKYCGEAVKKQCSDFLTDNLCSDNVCDVLVLADRHNDEDFKKDIMSYVIKQKIPYVGEKWTVFSKENPVLAVEVYHLFCEQFHSK